ncbi:MAG: hypothetical protein H0V51_03165 [Chloroflexi bacterium]|nr:hypothetical protein [Chloroflexota bacterium]
MVEDVEETRTAGLKGGGHLERGAIVQLTGLEFDHLAERADAAGQAPSHQCQDVRLLVLGVGSLLELL